MRRYRCEEPPKPIAKKKTISPGIITPSEAIGTKPTRQAAAETGHTSKYLKDPNTAS